MKQPLSMSQLIIAAVLTALATRNDAQVTIRTLESSQNSFICGEEQILICEIEPYLNTMTWSKDGSPIPLASCSFSGCSINPSMSASYDFTFDRGNGIFHMEILTVTVADNGTIYSCANGFETDSVSSDVTVSDDFTVVNDSKKIDSNTTEVSVTTGCIHDNVAEGVKFEWWLQEVNNTSSEKRKINESESDIMNNSSVCIADPDCGISGYSFITNSVNITDEGVGKTYMIGVDVISGVTLINSVSFDLFFILNFPVLVLETPTSVNECGFEILTAIITIIVVVLQMSICNVYRYCSYRKQKYKDFLLVVHRNAKMKQRQLEDKHNRLKKKCLEDLKALQDECVRLVKIFTKNMKSLSLNEDERFRSVLQIESHLKSPSLENDVRNSLEKQLRAKLKAISLEDEIYCLEKRFLADLKALHLEVERFRLVKQFATDLKKLHLEENRSRLKKPAVGAIFWITLFCSVPFIGLVIKGILVYNRWKSDHPQFWEVIFALLFFGYSFACELFMILLCKVLCIFQWYALILLFPELISRWILCIIIAELYYGDIDTTNPSDDMPPPSTGRIALSCMPIIGCIYKFLRHVRNKICKKSVSPGQDEDHRTGETNRDANSSPRTMHTANNNQHTPRPLRKLPKVSSSSQLSEITTTLNKHLKVPQIGSKKHDISVI